MDPTLASGRELVVRELDVVALGAAAHGEPALGLATDARSSAATAASSSSTRCATSISGVATYEFAGSDLVVRGSGFAASGNEVWLTSATSGQTGVPLKVMGLLSNGTELVLPFPADAVAGDLLVRVPGTGGDALSNAMPFDPAAEPCPIPLIYGAPKLTSQGTLPALWTSGRPRLSLDDFVIATDGGVPNANGILFYGGAQTSAPFFGGTLLCMRPLVRAGMFQLDFLGRVVLPIPVTPALVGTTRCYQLWFQDAGDPYGVGLSNAVRVTFCP